MTDRDARSLQRCAGCHDPRIFHVPQCRYKRCDCKTFVEENADAVLDHPAVDSPAPLRPAGEGAGVALESEPAGPQPAPVAQRTRAFQQGVETIMRGLREHKARGARWE